YPKRTEEMNDPTCPAEFIAAVTVPAYCLPMSKHTAQAVGMMKSEAPKLSARSVSAAYLFVVTIVATVNRRAAQSPAMPTVRRPHLIPKRSTKSRLRIRHANSHTPLISTAAWKAETPV